MEQILLAFPVHDILIFYISKWRTFQLNSTAGQMVITCMEFGVESEDMAKLGTASRSSPRCFTVL